MKSAVPCFIFLLLSIALFSPYESSAQRVKSLEDFHSNNVSIIDITASGKAWIGTPTAGCGVDSAGIWTTFDTTTTPMQSNDVTSICLYPISGTVHSFMGTTRGVAYRYLTSSGPVWDSLRTLPDLAVRGMVRSSRDSLWVSTGAGISLYNDTSLQHLKYYNTNLGPDSSSISCMQSNISSSRGFAAGTYSNGFYFTTDGNAFTHITVSSGGLVDDHVNCIYTQTGGGTYYIGTTGGLSVYSGSSTNYTTSNGLPSDDITTLTKDCRDRLWIGTRAAGLAIYDGTTFHVLDTAHGLSTNRITSIACDPSCTCWVGTSDMGIIKIDSSLSQFTTVNLPTGITNISTDAPIHIYPQPASSQLTFSIPTADGPMELSIMDISGREMLNELIKSSAQSLSVNSLGNGVYIYQISAAGRTAYRGKVIIAR